MKPQRSPTLHGSKCFICAFILGKGMGESSRQRSAGLAACLHHPLVWVWGHQLLKGSLDVLAQR